jgi:hypothetical protein
VPETQDLERELRALDAALRQLEAEYNMYFAGRLPRPPVESRKRVEQMVTRLDRMYIQNYADRFRFTTLQARFSTFTDLWDRGLKNREVGRHGSFSPPRREEPPPSSRTDESAKHDERGTKTDDTTRRRSNVESFKDPVNEKEKLNHLYEQMVEARRSVGEASVPFNNFTELVQSQVHKLQQKGNSEVAFKVAVKDGKVSLTAKGLKGSGT